MREDQLPDTSRRGSSRSRARSSRAGAKTVSPARPSRRSRRTVAQAVTGNVGQWDQIERPGKSGLSEVEVRDGIRAALAEVGAAPSSSRRSPASSSRRSRPTTSRTTCRSSTPSCWSSRSSRCSSGPSSSTTRSRSPSRSARASSACSRALGASRPSGRGLGRARGARRRRHRRRCSGCGSGSLIVKPLEALLSAFGIDLPSGPLQIEPRTIVVSLLVGTGVTFVSALAPARRAARVPPIAALRDQALPRVVGSAPLPLGRARRGHRARRARSTGSSAARR